MLAWALNTSLVFEDSSNVSGVMHKSISSKIANFFRYRGQWVRAFSVKNDELD